MRRKSRLKSQRKIPSPTHPWGAMSSKERKHLSQERDTLGGGYIHWWHSVGGGVTLWRLNTFWGWRPDWQFGVTQGGVKQRCRRVCSSRSRGPWGPGAPLAPRISLNHAVFRQFWGKNPCLEQILGSGSPLEVKTPLGPPDQNPGSAPGLETLELQNYFFKGREVKIWEWQCQSVYGCNIECDWKHLRQVGTFLQYLFAFPS